MSAHVVPDVTCLGCGLACDDVAVTVADGRIADIAPACPVGRAWFGDGAVPARIAVRGADASFAAAIAAAEGVLVPATGRVLVVLAPGLSTRAVTAGIAIADRLRATVDTATSAGAAEGILAGQRRGRAASTLGELRNRADVVLFWGCDPARTHPRFLERVAPGPRGTHVADGRLVLAVQVGDAAPEGLAVTTRLAPDDEPAALAVMRSVVLGQAGEVPAALSGVAEVATRLAGARYAGIVAGGEDDDAAGAARRAEGLIALAMALNGPTRAAMVTLRAGGNRNGVESALSWQAGFPFAVDYASGAPRYEPSARGLARPGAFRAALVLGEWSALGEAARAALGRVPTVVVGPRASEAPFGPAVAVDTGVAGIHEGGTAYRLDDVPLPLTPVLDGARTAAMAVAALAEALG